MYNFLRKVMALPFLPEEQIPVAFLALKEEVTTERLHNFMAYVEKTWISHSTFSPDTWSVYMMSIRTNNGVYIICNYTRIHVIFVTPRRPSGILG